MKDNGGPAFPTDDYTFSGGVKFRAEKGYCGMSLRDWFASMAIQGLAREEMENHVAKCAYELADAMLKERKKE